MFARGSGRHWCESEAGGHERLLGLEEPVNTFSSLWIALFNLLWIALDFNYAKRVRPSVAIVYVAVLFVAGSSAYFHATLSLFAQLLDELGLVWTATATFIVWLPGFGTELKARRSNELRLGFLCLGVVYTGLCFLRPHLNAFLLMSSTVMIFASICKERELVPSAALRRLSIYSLCIGLAAVAFWTTEELACVHLQKIGFPYLHGLWHILSGMAAYFSLLFYGYSDAWKLGLSPQLKWFAGLYPYLVVKDAHPHGLKGL